MIAKKHNGLHLLTSIANLITCAATLICKAIKPQATRWLFAVTCKIHVNRYEQTLYPPLRVASPKTQLSAFQTNLVLIDAELEKWLKYINVIRWRALFSLNISPCTITHSLQLLAVRADSYLSWDCH